VLNITLDPDALRPLVQTVVEEVLSQLEQARAALPADRLAFSEPEAAALLGLRPHQLRDERLRHRIAASTGPGQKILYTRDDLLAYLASRRWRPDGDDGQRRGQHLNSNGRKT
jgi:hypothetical protein